MDAKIIKRCGSKETAARSGRLRAESDPGVGTEENG